MKSHVKEANNVLYVLNADRQLADVRPMHQFSETWNVDLFGDRFGDVVR